MRENLHRFFRAARGAGVRLSPAESIDAMRAVSKVGFTDRTVLRDTFLLTLAKTQDEKKALGDCFDLFFDQPEPAPPPPEESETIGWARVLVLLQATELDHEMVKDTLNVLLKYEADIEATLPQVSTFIAKTSRQSVVFG